MIFRCLVEKRLSTVKRRLVYNFVDQTRRVKTSKMRLRPIRWPEFKKPEST